MFNEQNGEVCLDDSNLDEHNAVYRDQRSTLGGRKNFGTAKRYEVPGLRHITADMSDMDWKHSCSLRALLQARFLWR